MASNGNHTAKASNLEMDFDAEKNGEQLHGKPSLIASSCFELQANRHLADFAHSRSIETEGASIDLHSGKMTPAIKCDGNIINGTCKFPVAFLTPDDLLLTSEIL